MRAEVEHHPLLSLAQDHGICESRETRYDLDGSTSSIVQNTVFEGPSIDVPHPAGDRAVNDGGPDEGKNHGGNETTSLSDGAHYDSGSDSTELHL